MDVRTSTQRRWLRSHVASIVTSMTGEPATTDSDGDYPVRGTTSQAWVRLTTGDPCGVHVFGYAARDVPGRAAVLRELNQHNWGRLGTRVAWSDGLVLVDSFLFADAITEETLTLVLRRVLALADQLGPVLTAVHGGTTYLEASSASAA